MRNSFLGWIFALLGIGHYGYIGGVSLRQPRAEQANACRRADLPTPGPRQQICRFRKHSLSYLLTNLERRCCLTQVVAHSLDLSGLLPTQP